MKISNPQNMNGEPLLTGIVTSGAITGDGTPEHPLTVNTSGIQVQIDSTITADGVNAVQGGAIYSALEGKADVEHEHQISEVAGLQTELDGKADSGTVDQLGETVSSLDSSIAGLQSALDEKADSSVTGQLEEWISSLDSTVSDLYTAVDSKADAYHEHSIEDVTGLDSALSEFAYAETVSATISAIDDRVYALEYSAVMWDDLDDELDSTSMNPIRNNAITSAFNVANGIAGLDSSGKISSSVIPDLSSIYVAVSAANTSNGYAKLDANGKVPTSLLPSYVSDVFEGYLVSGVFHKTNSSSGEVIEAKSNAIYVDKTTEKTYRWSGSQYTEISKSLALGTTSETAYPGDSGAALASAVSSHTTQISGKLNTISGTNTNVLVVASGGTAVSDGGVALSSLVTSDVLSSGLASKADIVSGVVPSSQLPVATNSTLGVVMGGVSDRGVRVSSDGGYLYLSQAGTNEIASRTSPYKPIVPQTLNTAVTAALTDSNHITLTAEQQATAKEVLGIVEAGGLAEIDNATDATAFITAENEGKAFLFTGTTDATYTQGHVYLVGSEETSSSGTRIHVTYSGSMSNVAGDYDLVDSSATGSSRQWTNGYYTISYGTSGTDSWWRLMNTSLSTVYFRTGMGASSVDPVFDTWYATGSGTGTMSTAIAEAALSAIDITPTSGEGGGDGLTIIDNATDANGFVIDANEGKVFIFTGETTSSYIKGHVYQVVAESSGETLTSIVVSEAGTSNVNGTYTLQDSSATGTSRVWTNGTYYIWGTGSGTPGTYNWFISTQTNTPPAQRHYGFSTTNDNPLGMWSDCNYGSSPAPTLAAAGADYATADITPASETDLSNYYTSSQTDAAITSATSSFIEKITGTDGHLLTVVSNGAAISDGYAVNSAGALGSASNSIPTEKVVSSALDGKMPVIAGGSNNWLPKISSGGSVLLNGYSVKTSGAISNMSTSIPTEAAVSSSLSGKMNTYTASGSGYVMLSVSGGQTVSASTVTINSTTALSNSTTKIPTENIVSSAVNAKLTNAIMNKNSYANDKLLVVTSNGSAATEASVKINSGTFTGSSTYVPTESVVSSVVSVKLTNDIVTKNANANDKLLVVASNGYAAREASVKVNSGTFTGSSTYVPTESTVSSYVSSNTHSIPSGGSAGQALVKTSGTDYAVEWGNIAAGGDVLVASTASEMTGLMSSENEGKVILFVGETDSTYTNGHYYLVAQGSGSAIQGTASSEASANGTYMLVDPSATGTDRVWSNGTCDIRYGLYVSNAWGVSVGYPSSVHDTLFYTYDSPDSASPTWYQNTALGTFSTAPASTIYVATDITPVGGSGNGDSLAEIANATEAASFITAENNGKAFIFTGETDEDYSKGHIYQVVEDSGAAGIIGSQPIVRDNNVPGTYTLVDQTATGNDRVWKNEHNYYIMYVSGYGWCLQTQNNSSSSYRLWYTNTTEPINSSWSNWTGPGNFATELATAVYMVNDITPAGAASGSDIIVCTTSAAMTAACIADNLGKVCLYIGETDANYTKGHHYEVVPGESTLTAESNNTRAAGTYTKNGNSHTYNGVTYPDYVNEQGTVLSHSESGTGYGLQATSNWNQYHGNTIGSETPSISSLDDWPSALDTGSELSFYASLGSVNITFHYSEAGVAFADLDGSGSDMTNYYTKTEVNSAITSAVSGYLSGITGTNGHLLTVASNGAAVSDGAVSIHKSGSLTNSSGYVPTENIVSSGLAGKLDTYSDMYGGKVLLSVVGGKQVYPSNYEINSSTAMGSSMTKLPSEYVVKNYITSNTHSIPSGGTTGQALVKTSNADYAAEWSNAAGGDVLVASTVSEMNGFLNSENEGKVVFFVGDTDSTYTNGHYYLVAQSFNTGIHGTASNSNIATANGTYLLVDPTATGNARVWTNGTCYIRYGTGMSAAWCLHENSSTSSDCWFYTFNTEPVATSWTRSKGIGTFATAVESTIYEAQDITPVGGSSNAVTVGADSEESSLAISLVTELPSNPDTNTLYFVLEENS